jgi:hypothetical protein
MGILVDFNPFLAHFSPKTGNNQAKAIKKPPFSGQLL